MRTVGVEEELLLVDPETGDPRALSAAVLARAERDPADSDVFEKELHGQMLEFATHPQSSLAELEKEIVRCRADAARHAASTGAAVAALATSPLPVSPQVSTSERYQWMVDRYGLPTQEQMVCGCHVHVSVESDEEGVAVLDRIRNWLPVLTALSANSPFWQGKETGYRSYRRQVWERWPSAGSTEPFGTPEEYHRRTDAMVATGAILDRHMAYYDARLSDRYPTVEIRVSDVCLDADTPVLIAALARGLVDTAAAQWRAGVESAASASVSLLKLAAWQASSSGLEGDLLHPLTFRPAPAREVVTALLEHIDDSLRANGDRDLAHRTVERLFAEGNGARVQYEVWEKTGSLRDVVLEAVRRTAAGTP